MSGEQIIGAVAVLIGLFGLITYILYLTGVKGREVFRKLEPMQESLGKELGTGLHFTCYVILPMVVGAVLLTR